MPEFHVVLSPHSHWWAAGSVEAGKTGPSIFAVIHPQSWTRCGTPKKKNGSDSRLSCFWSGFPSIFVQKGLYPCSKSVSDKNAYPPGVPVGETTVVRATKTRKKGASFGSVNPCTEAATGCKNKQLSFGKIQLISIYIYNQVRYKSDGRAQWKNQVFL